MKPTRSRATAQPCTDSLLSFFITSSFLSNHGQRVELDSSAPPPAPPSPPSFGPASFFAGQKMVSLPPHPSSDITGTAAAAANITALAITAHNVHFLTVTGCTGVLLQSVEKEKTSPDPIEPDTLDP